MQGISPVDFCLEIALGEERASREAQQILAAAAKKNELQVTKTALGFMVTHSSDVVIGQSLRDTGTFEETDISAAIAVIEELGKPVGKGVFLDVGANIGTHSLHAIGQGFSRCITIEPDALNFKLLRTNQILNGKDDRFINVRAAASDADSTGVLEISPDNFGDHRVKGERSGTLTDVHREDTRGFEEVRLARIDTVLAENKIAAGDLGLVWMDTQGHEGHALAGAASLKSSGVPIVAEFWPYGLERSGGYKLLRNFLSEKARVYDLRDIIATGKKTLLTLEDIDRLYDDMLKGESSARALYTDLIILFDA
jgi:FkbM family methyltransferase